MTLSVYYRLLLLANGRHGTAELLVHVALRTTGLAAVINMLQLFEFSSQLVLTVKWTHHALLFKRLLGW